jgi:hypothetical protein
VGIRTTWPEGSGEPRRRTSGPTRGADSAGGGQHLHDARRKPGVEHPALVEQRFVGAKAGEALDVEGTRQPFRALPEDAPAHAQLVAQVDARQVGAAEQHAHVVARARPHVAVQVDVEHVDVQRLAVAQVSRPSGLQMRVEPFEHLAAVGRHQADVREAIGPDKGHGDAGVRRADAGQRGQGNGEANHGWWTVHRFYEAAS